jgi:hypothetical protein
MRDCVKGERESRVDYLVVGSGHYVGLACGELRSALRFPGTHIHAERPIDSVEDYSIFSFGGGIARL